LKNKNYLLEKLDNVIKQPRVFLKRIEDQKSTSKPEEIFHIQSEDINMEEDFQLNADGTPSTPGKNYRKENEVAELKEKLKKAQEEIAKRDETIKDLQQQIFHLKYKADENEALRILSANGVNLSPAQILEVKALKKEEGTKCINTLIPIIFGVDTLKISSVTGQACISKKEAAGANKLDEKKLHILQEIYSNYCTKEESPATFRRLVNKKIQNVKRVRRPSETKKGNKKRKREEEPAAIITENTPIVVVLDNIVVEQMEQVGEMEQMEQVGQIGQEQDEIFSSQLDDLCSSLY
jgi:hypothetical protein